MVTNKMSNILESSGLTQDTINLVNRRINCFASINNISIDDVILITKSELVIGETYSGECRNSETATWNGKKFEYKRYKFGTCYTDIINHYEDDDGYDVFVPMKIKNHEKDSKTKE